MNIREISDDARVEVCFWAAHMNRPALKTEIVQNPVCVLFERLVQDRPTESNSLALA